MIVILKVVRSGAHMDAPPEEAMLSGEQLASQQEQQIAIIFPLGC
jgi:hypothetical protein